MAERPPLLPCPFCNGQGYPAATLRDGYADCPDDPDAHSHFIRCRSCAAQGPWHKSATAAVRWWNMRGGKDLEG